MLRPTYTTPVRPPQACTDNLRELVNYRHPGLGRVRNLGSELPAVSHFRWIRSCVLGGSIFGISFSKTATLARKRIPQCQVPNFWKSKNRRRQLLERSLGLYAPQNAFRAPDCHIQRTPHDFRSSDTVSVRRRLSWVAWALGPGPWGLHFYMED